MTRGNGRMVAGATALAAALGVAAWPATAQTAAPPVPQVFDWWQAEGIPATAPWGQALDTTATRMIRSWTTAPELTSPLVDHLPYDPVVVSPADHWGYASGRPGHLHRVDDLYEYFEALAASTGRVRIEYLGKTEEDNQFALVQVGSEENLARLEQVRHGYQRLADPRGTTQEEADALIRDLPVIHMVFAGLHSRETGHPEIMPELAYRVAVSEDPMVREIRDNVVLFIVPVTEPDGRNRVVDWYRRHGADIYEHGDRPPGPPFWGTYIRHDNNRDGIQMTLRLSRQVVDLFETWKYPMALDLHESFPFMFISGGWGNFNYDPITRQEWQWIAQYEVTGMTALGMPGVWLPGAFDAWNPGYMIFAPNNRNAIGRLYETFGNDLPTTMHRRISENFTTVQWHRLNPPYPEVIWSLRNNINYAQTGVLHSLHLAARHPDIVLRNYWTKANNSLRRGRTEAPYAYVFPTAQPRKSDVAHLLQLLRDHGIEVHRATAGATLGGVEVRAGDHLVRMDQPYRDYIKNLMEVQAYPEHFPDPLDDVAWTLPLSYNITAHAVADSAVLGLAMAPATEIRIPGVIRPGTTAGAPDWWVVRYAASAQALEARHALRDVPVHAAQQAFDVPGAGRFTAGTWLVPGDALDADRLAGWVERFGLEAVAATDAVIGPVPRHRQDFPRIALLHTWLNTQEDGSIRYALDRMRVPYTYLPEDRLAGTDLRDRFDVVIFPDQGRRASARRIFDGIDRERGPLPYTRTAEYPTHGYPSSSEDITGGMGDDGLAALRAFVVDGGTLLALGSAARFAIEYDLAEGASLRRTEQLASPGSIVQGVVSNAAHPVTYGYDAEIPVFDRFGPYFDVVPERAGNVVVRYGAASELLLSGHLRGAEEMAGYPAVAVLPSGAGYVVLYGVRVLHRHQTQGSFALAWNALLNWNHLGAGLVAADGAGDLDIELDGNVEVQGAAQRQR